jgi:hypothetical protein
MDKKHLLLVLLVISLISCFSKKGAVNTSNLERVKIGMSLIEVHQVMTVGPISSEKAYWSDSLFLESYESEFGMSDHHRIIYSMKDSIVVEISFGD